MPLLLKHDGGQVAVKRTAEDIKIASSDRPGWDVLVRVHEKVTAVPATSVERIGKVLLAASRLERPS